MTTAFALLMATTATAQGTADDYKQAFATRGKYSGKMIGGDVSVHRKRGEPHKFWYSVYDGKETVYKEVDAEQNTVTLLKENPQPPRRQQWRGPQRHWIEVPDEKDGFRRSPTDSTLTIFHRADNLWTRRDGVEKPLTTNGDSTYYYSAWGTFSPDGRYYATVRIKPAPKHYVYYVESFPITPRQTIEAPSGAVRGASPILHKQEYAKPGDSLNYRVPVVVEVESGRVVEPSTELFSRQYQVSAPSWDKSGQTLTFTYNERGHKVYRVLEMDVATGRVRTLIEETNPKYVNYNRLYRHDFDDGRHILWTSERDGRNHIYLYDRQKAKLVRQITKGEFYVRDIQRVDEKAGIVYFSACGMNKQEDPYLVHYYKIGVDGKHLTSLTPEEGNHSVTYTEDMQYLIDTYSTVTTPPVTVLRSGKDGSILRTLETADISRLKTEGWTAPEVFVAPGRDGVTQMWGLIRRPRNFDPTKKYPVISSSYSLTP